MSKPKKYRVVRRGVVPVDPYYLWYEYVITDGERVNAATPRLRHTLDWSWDAFLVYAKAKGWVVDEL